jgi:hypothetical protein
VLEVTAEAQPSLEQKEETLSSVQSLLLAAVAVVLITTFQPLVDLAVVLQLQRTTSPEQMAKQARAIKVEIHQLKISRPTVPAVVARVA